ncbi:hypothetical protein TEA_007726 [Camellia sinensis var. sinensis]|uniref:Inhibitor I9 domain-containing protein n=1 Tax=Camellia sinensis var. sinensis TaxID=542762 RepID=A0A4S4CZX5_CAMSN|nr:hypothetical protein TEA_007726 [Camellia sinensis var. sinensis]
MQLANIISGDDDGEDGINQLFLHEDISKPGQKESLHFLCGLYPDALGIHSVSMRPKLETSGFLVVPTKYNGPVFQDLDEGMRDALHSYIEERAQDTTKNFFPVQVLVYHDLLGMMQHPHHAKVTPKFCKQYGQVGDVINKALSDVEQARASHVYSYRHGFRGFTTKLTEDQAFEIAKMPGVVSMFPNNRRRLHTTHSWDFMGLLGEETMEIPGYSTKNQVNVVIGFIDTGFVGELHPDKNSDNKKHVLYTHKNIIVKYKDQVLCL